MDVQQQLIKCMSYLMDKESCFYLRKANNSIFIELTHNKEKWEFEFSYNETIHIKKYVSSEEEFEGNQLEDIFKKII